MSDTVSRWRELLDTALSAPGASSKTVGKRLGIAGSYVRRAIAGNFPGGVPEKFIRRVLDQLDTQDCPHLLRPITADECRAYALRACPTSSVREVRHWKACQGCDKKPEGGTK